MGGITAEQNSDSDDNRPISFCVKKKSGGEICRFPTVKSSQDYERSHKKKPWLEWDLLKEMQEFLVDQQILMFHQFPGTTGNPDATNIINMDETFSSPVQGRDQQHDKMAESERKSKTEEDPSGIKVYKKLKTKRNLSTTMDTQEPDTQSVSDIHLSTAMDPQEPGTQSLSDIQPVEDVSVDAAAQGANPDKAANTDEGAIPDQAAIPDEGANPDEGVTPDREPIPDETTIPDASTAAQMATQEPFTQSVKEIQAPQEPPTQRVEESLNEAESGKFSNLLSFISRFICKNEY